MIFNWTRTASLSLPATNHTNNKINRNKLNTVSTHKPEHSDLDSRNTLQRSVTNYHVAQLT